jgi:hypothetical protein
MIEQETDGMHCDSFADVFEYSNGCEEEQPCIS